jgi:poly(3-hydroxybutyrate) depolymerase
MRFRWNIAVKVGFTAALCLLFGLVQFQFVLAQPAPQARGAGARGAVGARGVTGARGATGARGMVGFGMRTDPRVENRTYRFTDTDEDMPYALFVSSKVSEDKKNPLIIALHGLGGSPTTLMMGNALDLAEEGGYIYVGPMGYNSSGWYGIPGMSFMGGGFGGGGNAPANAHELSEKDVMNVLDIIRKEFNVDESRIYLMGHSMGGAGAFNLGAKYPDIWAAIGAMAPAAFTIQPTIFENAKNLPVIVIQGDADTLVPATNTRRWVEKFKELEMTYKYNEVAGGDHGSVMTSGMPDIFAFFAEYSKPASEEEATTETTAEPADETPEAEDDTTDTTTESAEAIPTANETSSRTIEDGGTGPYKAILVADSSLATHTIFRPKDLSPFGENGKLPIFAWGNGGCIAWFPGDRYRPGTDNRRARSRYGRHGRRWRRH